MYHKIWNNTCIDKYECQSFYILVHTTSILISAKQIIDDITAAKNMKALCLTGNTLGVDAAKAIAKALEGHPEFEVC